jgi:5-methylcytosine-specific restriction protein A
MPIKPKSYRPANHKTSDQRRGSAASRGYGRRWQAASSQFKADNPLCVECLKDGIVEAAFAVDHIIPHRGDQRLFWATSNWQSLCRTHHSRKTARGE